MILYLILQSTSIIDNVQKLLELGFLENLIQSSLSNDLEIRVYALRAISKIQSFKNERIYIVNKMSEFELLFDEDSFY